MNSVGNYFLCICYFIVTIYHLGLISFFDNQQRSEAEKIPKCGFLFFFGGEAAKEKEKTTLIFRAYGTEDKGGKQLR